MWATLRLGSVVCVASAALGAGMAWVIERTDVPGRRVLAALAPVPLVVPTYVGALALLAAVGPRGVLTEMPGLIGFWGAAIALTLSTYPYVLLPARAAIATLDPALEEAARGLGDTPRRVLWRVVVPQLRPAVAAGALLSFLYVLSDFGAVALLRYDTLTRGIFLEYQSSFDRAPAAVLGVVLAVLTIGALAAERRVRGRVVPLRAAAGLRPAARSRLGHWRWPVAGGVVAVVVAGVGFPVVLLAYWAVARRGSGDPFALAGAASASVGLSAAAAVVAVALALPVAVLAVRHRSRFSRVVEALSFAGYALPGLVIGLALVFAAARYLPAIYQTHLVVVIAYVVRFLPESLGAVRTSLGRVDPALEEASRSLGQSSWRTTVAVTLPLVRPGLLAGGALVFLTSMKELPATLLLRPAGTDTLAVLVWIGAGAGRYGLAAIPALVLVAVSALVLLPLRTVRTRGAAQ